MVVIGYWPNRALAKQGIGQTGHWALVISHWSLVISDWSLVRLSWTFGEKVGGC